MKTREKSYLALGAASVAYLWIVWSLASAYPEYHQILVGSFAPALGSWIAWVILTEMYWGNDK